MIIYKDILTGDEIISDSYPMKDINDTVYEVDCKKVTQGGESFDIGANASAEEADEGVEDGTKTVIDVVSSFRLNFAGDESSGSRIFPTKKDYQSYFKGYLKKVTDKLKTSGKSEEEIKSFQSGVQEYFKNTISPNFKDYDFYLGESMDAEGMVVLLNYREDGMTPYVTIWKHGLIEMKV